MLTATFCFTQSIYNYITYSTIDSNPAITYTSVISTIRCFEVTSGPSAGSTYVQWSAHFSSDADAGRLLVSIIFFALEWWFGPIWLKVEKENVFSLKSLFLLTLRPQQKKTGVIEDARYKRKEALADLANAVTK